MIACMRFLGRNYLLNNLLAVAIIGASAVLLNLIFPGGYFESYYNGYPMMAGMFFLLFTGSTPGPYANTALAMGARRAHLAAAAFLCMAISLAAVLGFVFLVSLAVYVPPFSHSQYEYNYLFSVDSLPMFVLFYFCAQMLGLGCGTLSLKSRRAAIAAYALTAGIYMLAFMLMIFMTLMDTHILFGQLSLALTLVCTASAAAGAVYFLRNLKNMTVR